MILKVKDVMTRDVVSVKRGTPIYEAVETLLKNEITRMPVIEDDKRLGEIILRFFAVFRMAESCCVAVPATAKQHHYFF